MIPKDHLPSPSSSSLLSFRIDSKQMIYRVKILETRVRERGREIKNKRDEKVFRIGQERDGDRERHDMAIDHHQQRQGITIVVLLLFRNLFPAE